MAEYEYVEINNDNSEPLDPDIIAKVEECGRDIEEATGIKLTFAYDYSTGFNISGPGGWSGSVYVANFYLDGSYSGYDAWEYGEKKEEAIYTRLKALVKSVSQDGELHVR